MSHFTYVKVDVKDINVFDAVAKSLGLTRVERKEVRGYAGQKEKADYVWEVNKNYDIGLRKKDEGYELVADWWGCGFTHPDLQRKLLQGYAEKVLLRQAKLLGHILVRREEQPDGSIRLVIRTAT